MRLYQDWIIPNNTSDLYIYAVKLVKNTKTKKIYSAQIDQFIHDYGIITIQKVNWSVKQIQKIPNNAKF